MNEYILQFLPEIIICAVALLILVLDIIIPVKKKDIFGIIALIGILPVFFILFNFLNTSELPVPWRGFVLDQFSLFFKLAILLSTAFVILMSINFSEISHSRKGAFYALLMFSCLSMFFLVSSTDLLMIFLNIEFLSITSYALVGFIKKDPKSAEGSVKYFLLGIFASSIMIYGMSLIYGLTGTLDLNAIKWWAFSESSNSFLFFIATIFLIVGFGFKMALVPFHSWVPDAYEGAPTPITAYLSVASKGAALAVFLRVFISSIPAPIWLFAALSAITMTAANLMAVPQKNIKRLLAYSSISHVGYMMIGFVAMDVLGTEAILIYILAYLFMNLGAFAVVIAVSNKIKSENIDDYAGLSEKSPFLSGILAVFLLSLAGIPPMAGFIGKFYIFGAAIKTGYVWLAVVGILNSVIALFYYFRVVHSMYFVQSASQEKIHIPFALKFSLAVLGIMVLIIGIYPQPFIELVNLCANIF